MLPTFVPRRDDGRFVRPADVSSRRIASAVRALVHLRLAFVQMLADSMPDVASIRWHLAVARHTKGRDALDGAERLDDVTEEDGFRSLCFRGLRSAPDFDDVINRAEGELLDAIQRRIDNPPCPYGDDYDHHQYWCDCY